jgi:gliding motility-associated-like protein
VEAVVNNCTSARSAVKVNVNPTPSAPAVQDTTICSVESVVLNATDPQGATFLWYDAPSAGNLLFSGNPFTTPALNDTTTYYVEAVANNCTSARSAVTVNVVLLQTTDLLDSLCANQSHVLTVTPPANVNVLWYDNAGNFLSNQPNLTIQLGTNDTLFAYEFTVANCTSNRSTFTIQALPTPKAFFVVHPDKDTMLSVQDAVYDFTNLSQGAVRYVWYFGDGDSLVTMDLSNVTHQYTKEGQYDVTLCATNNYGCTDCYTYGKLIVANQIAIFIPNVFTPNGDGINDFFKFEMSGIQSAEIQIFDRWGVLIFETVNGLNTFWNGTKNGSPCPEGVYTYVMKLVRFDGKKITRFGSVMLLR